MEINEPFYVRRRPDPIPFRKFLYNDEKGTVMGRTGSSWGKWMLSVIIHKIAVSKVAPTAQIHLTYRCGILCCLLLHNFSRRHHT